jgi:hypothetical protein
MSRDTISWSRDGLASAGYALTPDEFAQFVRVMEATTAAFLEDSDLSPCEVCGTFAGVPCGCAL